MACPSAAGADVYRLVHLLVLMFIGLSICRWRCLLACPSAAGADVCRLVHLQVLMFIAVSFVVATTFGHVVGVLSVDLLHQQQPASGVMDTVQYFFGSLLAQGMSRVFSTSLAYCWRRVGHVCPVLFWLTARARKVTCVQYFFGSLLLQGKSRVFSTSFAHCSLLLQGRSRVFSTSLAHCSCRVSHVCSVLLSLTALAR